MHKCIVAAYKRRKGHKVTPAHTNGFHQITQVFVFVQVFARVLPILGQEEAPPHRQIDDWQLGKGGFFMFIFWFPPKRWSRVFHFDRGFYQPSIGRGKSWADGCARKTKERRRLIFSRIIFETDLLENFFKHKLFFQITIFICFWMICSKSSSSLKMLSCIVSVLPKNKGDWI